MNKCDYLYLGRGIKVTEENMKPLIQVSYGKSFFTRH